MTVKENARSSYHNYFLYCDNENKLTLKKNSEGDFKIYTHGKSFNNYQIEVSKDDIEWTADDGNWQDVIDMINTGTSLVQNIKVDKQNTKPKKLGIMGKKIHNNK